MLVSCIMGRRIAHAFGTVKPYTSKEIDTVMRAQKRMEQKFEQKWKDQNLDIVICPSSYHCAFRNREVEDLSTLAQYWMIWNVAHYPAGVVPITEVLEQEEGYYMDTHNDMWTKKIRATMQGSAGMPIGI